MKLSLNPELNKHLREKVNEWHNFTYEKQANFKSPEKRGKVIKAQAYNCLCACMDRIDELVEHCNTLDINSLFGLYDIFNYGQTLVDCISMISKIYDIPYETEGDISCFNQKGSILNIFVRFALYIPLKQVSTKYIKVMNLSGVLIFQDIVQCFQCLSLIILN